MKLKKHFLFVGFFLLFMVPVIVFGQVPEGTKMIIVRVYESPASYLNSHIVISYGNDKSETVELDTDTKKNAPTNLDKINRVFTRIEDQGFELVTATAILTYGANATTYVFRKSK